MAENKYWIISKRLNEKETAINNLNESAQRFIKQAEMELGEARLMVHEKILIYNGFTLRNLDLTGIDEGLKAIYQNLIDEHNINNLKKYSRYNHVVAIKRYYRIRKGIWNHWSTYLDVMDDLWLELAEIYDELVEDKSNPRTNKLFTQLEVLKSKLNSVKNHRFDNPHFVKELEFMFFGEDGLGTLSKNDVISLFNLDKSKETQVQLNKYPDQITIDDLWDMTFIHRLEEEEDCFAFENKYNLFVKTMLNNNEVKEEMNKVTDEVFGDLFSSIPTYSVATDSFGRATEIKRNKPTLRVVNGGIN
ncbi:hypothetical protein [Bacillus weihaiensis]|uniref:hypothetical protein n=1 Tax=Bacillus weihaiensis TaxID=1547283 RepID=UPI00235229B6|nr:hypothetical protein [Bacillus weihaiensis]